MEPWSPPQRPAVHAEQALVTAILDGHFPPGSFLPAERELAARLGVTRPTLREALRRLESDGWLSVQQGKATRVRDFWREGGLNVLSSLVRYSAELPPDFIPNLLQVRLAMAPAYTHAAVERAAPEISILLNTINDIPDSPGAFAAFDWKLHYTLTVWSGNPIYTLIINGFAGFYEHMAALYFSNPETRAASRRFYQSLADSAQKNDARAAERITRMVMEESIEYWLKIGQYASAGVEQG